MYPLRFREKFMIELVVANVLVRLSAIFLTASSVHCFHLSKERYNVHFLQLWLSSLSTAMSNSPLQIALEIDELPLLIDLCYTAEQLLYCFVIHIHGLIKARASQPLPRWLKERSTKFLLGVDLRESNFDASNVLALRWDELWDEYHVFLLLSNAGNPKAGRKISELSN